MTPDTLQEDIDKLMKIVRSKQDIAEKASQDNDDETLSLTLTALAMVNTSLGKKGAWANYIARNAQQAFNKIKEQKDIRRSELTLEYSKDQAVGKSEHQAKIISFEQYEEEIDKSFKIWSDAQQVADEVESLGYRVDSYCKFLQSRLSLIKADKR